MLRIFIRWKFWDLFVSVIFALKSIYFQLKHYVFIEVCKSYLFATEWVRLHISRFSPLPGLFTCWMYSSQWSGVSMKTHSMLTALLVISTPNLGDALPQGLLDWILSIHYVPPPTQGKCRDCSRNKVIQLKIRVQDHWNYLTSFDYNQRLSNLPSSDRLLLLWFDF